MVAASAAGALRGHPCAVAGWACWPAARTWRRLIGTALALAATGWGHRPVAARVGRAATTVPGLAAPWPARAERLRTGFTALAAALDPLAVMPDPTGLPVGGTRLAALLAAATAVGRWAACL